MIKIPDVIKEYPGYVGKDEYDLEDIKTIYINEPEGELAEPYKYLFIVKIGPLTLPQIMIWTGHVMLNTAISVEEISSK